MKVLVTGASGNGGQAVSRALLNAGFTVRMADVFPSSAADLKAVEFVRCDTRTPADVRRAVDGVDAVIHLAAWHCAHNPPVSDDTIFAVNVDGTFHVLEACREEGIKSIVYASSMAYGWGSVYGVTKVIGEELCRAYYEMTNASIAMLRYHEFIPRPYLEFGERLLRNGVDRRDIASATVASIKAALEQRIGLFRTIIHTKHGMPEEVIRGFRNLGPAWCEEHVPGSRKLLEKYNLSLPEQVEQHDLSEAALLLGWKPEVGFLDFLRDLKMRDERGIDVTKMWVPSELPSVE
ncbi:NAD-dependent epimerase/dehydratase family protein [Cohnella silvisoli]|uniref:NAD(P)-dependent oxidoreductase n=1 Tax=Cohnella silvisoli TaxID=2873699 RepID=A0ABV1L148_9BACL|nr:NAD(P)-dependent oxidoreductase [Cohnella silvisoli]MCD9025320.1 NAD(P)-dependent oxidoreductase [Cohnella silvisoli]